MKATLTGLSYMYHSISSRQMQEVKAVENANTNIASKAVPDIHQITRLAWLTEEDPTP